MANETVTQDTDDRTELVREAAGEIMCLGQMLAREENHDGFCAILRGALQRIHALSSVCLSVTGGDDGRTTAEMHEVIFGSELKVA